MLTINGPFGVASAMATNVIDTGTHSLKMCGGNIRSFVRASTTVGRNGDNNTLIGTENRLMNVGSMLCSPAKTCSNCKFTVPADVVAGIVTSLGRCKAIRHTMLNVGNAPVGSSRRVVPRRVGGGIGRLNTASNILVTRVVRKNSTTNGLRMSSIVVNVSKGHIGGFTRLRRKLTGRHPNSGMAIGILHSGGRGSVRVALGGTRKAAGIIGDTNVSVLNTTFHRIPRRLGERLGLKCNIRIANIASNGVGTTNVHGNFVVLGTGKRPIGSMGSLRSILGTTARSPSRMLFLDNVFPSNGHTGCTISLARRWRSFWNEGFR